MRRARPGESVISTVEKLRAVGHGKPDFSATVSDEVSTPAGGRVA